MALDRDALVDALFRYRDQIVILILIGIAVYGGYSVMDQYNQTVDDIIDEKLKNEARGGPGDEDPETAKKVVAGLLNKPPLVQLTRVKNPFGTPEEQLRLREELVEAYNQAFDAFRLEKYQEAIQILEEQVIPRDVTETRITYTVAPSEMIRQAEVALTRLNMDEVVARADADFRSGQTALGGNPIKALKMLRQALGDYQRVLEVDPEGKKLGEQRLGEMQTRVTQLTDQVLKLQRDTLRRSISQARQDLQAAQSSGNPSALVLSIARMRSAWLELEAIDSDQSIVPPTEREAIDKEFQAAQTTSLDTLPNVVDSVKQQLASGTLLEQNPQEIQSSLILLRESLQLSQASPKQDMAQPVLQVIRDYAEIVVTTMKETQGQLAKALEDEKYDAFDENAQKRLIATGQQLADSGLPPRASLRNRVAEMVAKLKELTLPPLLSDAYEVVAFRASSKRYYRVTVREKGTETAEPFNLELEKKGNKGFILLKVDTDLGSIILSKSPGFRPSQFSIPTE